MRAHLLFTTMALLASTTGCQTEPGTLGEFGSDTADTQPTGTSGQGIGGGDAGDGDDTTGASTASTATTATESDGGTGDAKFDVGTDPDVPMSEGCGKIDFLFVIDNSMSMQEEQENLIQSFPGFISEIETVTNAQDFHIMVTTAQWGDDEIGRCAKKCDTSGDPTCFWNENIACEDSSFIDASTWPCADSLGVGVDTDLGGNSCDLVGGNPYIIDTQPNLGDAFECIARVGTGGSVYEFPMDAQIFATSEAFNAPMGCHAGFLRDDAILVVTFVTDEAGNDWGGADTVYDALVAAKNGDPSAIVMLGLFGDTHLNNAVCTTTDQNMGGAHAGPHFQSFVDKFGDHGQWASVCEPDYAPFFASVVSTIDTTCDEFEPAG